MEQRFVTATMNVIEFSQLLTQGLWFHSSPLLQIPHIDQNGIKYLHKAITSGSYGSEEGELSNTAICAKLEKVSRENWARDFGIPEIMMMRELNQRAPQLFRKRIVQVDLAKKSPEEARA